MNVHIKQIKLKISGIPPEVAQQALKGLGPVLSERLRAVSRTPSSHVFKTISARPIHTTSDVSHQLLCDRIADSIAHGVLTSLGRKTAR